MRKNIIYILFSFIAFFVGICFCYATTYYVSITGNGVNLRSGAGTSYSSIKTLTKGKSYTMVSNTLYEDEGNGCASGWYQIYYDDDTTGYVCSTYVTVITPTSSSDAPTTECEQELYDAGFPASYWSGLCSLKSSHSNWNFVPIITNLDWSEVVEKESACGKSLIASSASSSYKDTSCTVTDGSFVAASKTAVAYYMDPRNWFSENTIFQFEYLGYDDSLTDSYLSAVETIIGTSSFYTYHYNLGTNLASIITEAGKSTNVSPIFLAARMLQELGRGESLYNLYSGAYTTYPGYYNFFNIGVSTSCNNTYGATLCGLAYAMGYSSPASIGDASLVQTTYYRPWNTVTSAITGASSYLSSGYISVGQNTLYLQKFNINPTDSAKLYTHQYMTNLAAPSSEAKTTYSSYNSLGLLSTSFTFYIPVYLNMDEIIDNSSSGAISDESEDGSDLSISYIISAAGYTLSNNYVYIENSTEADDVISAIKAISGNTVTITDSNSSSVTDGIVGTGYKITVKNNTEEEELTIVVRGDTSGDGKINALDLLQVQKYILGTYTLTDAYFLAGDTSSDSKINALDLLQVQKHILGTYTIE